MAEAKKFTYAQVKEHNKAEDCWMVINDKVYDVTKFLNEVGFLYDIIIDIEKFIALIGLIADIFLSIFCSQASWWRRCFG